MARKISLELNDTSEAAIDWAVKQINARHIGEKDYEPLTPDAWIQMRAAEVINAERINKFNEEFEAARIAEMKKQGLA